MPFDHEEVRRAAQRAIEALAPCGYDAQRDVLVLLQAYTECRNTLKHAGIISAGPYQGGDMPEVRDEGASIKCPKCKSRQTKLQARYILTERPVLACLACGREFGIKLAERRQP
jgi:hypothetical protein